MGVGILNVERLAGLPREMQRRALEGAVRRAAGDAAALAEVREVAQRLGLEADGFEPKAAARCPFHVAAATATAADAPPLEAPALEALIGVRSVFQLGFSDGDVRLLVGTLKKVTPNHFGGIDLEFRSYEPDQALKLLGEQTRLFVPGRPFLEVHTVRGLAHVQAAVPLASIEGLEGMAPVPTPRARIGEAARAAVRDGPSPRVDLAQEWKRASDAVARPRLHPPTLLEGLKWDQNVLSAPLIDHAVTNALGRLEGSAGELLERTPLPDSLQKQSAVQRLAGVFQVTLREAIQALDVEPLPGNLPAIKDHLDDLLAFKATQGMPQNGRTASLLVTAGAGTFTNLVEEVATFLPALFEARMGRPGEPKELAAVFGRSFALFRNLARADLTVFTSAVARLFHSRTQDAFRLVGEDGDLRLELDPKMADDLERTVGARLDARLGATTGCPAMVTFAGVNAVDRLLARFAALLPEAYVLDQAAAAR